MFGSSRTSLALLQEFLDSRRGAGEQVSADLLAVTDLLERSQTLRMTLNDTGTPGPARAGIVADLLGDSLSPQGMEVLQEVVAARWSHDGDMVDALESLGAQAALRGAQEDGTLETVSDELFTFGRAVAASSELQLVLTDPAVPSQRKAALADELSAAAAPVTRVLLRHRLAHLRGRSPYTAIEQLSQAAARQRSRVIADVTAATPLTDAQRERLRGALGALTGHDVRLNVSLDPQIVGGIVVKVGDEVIDGSLATRLEQARRAMSA
jgi:F-type H+-transporting ATPase subunit delta